MPGRRAVIRASALTIAALTTGRLHRVVAQDDDPFDPGGRVRIDYDETLSFNELYGYPPLLGRVEGWWLRIVSAPDRYDDVLRYAHYDQVLPIYRAIRAEPPYPYFHNDVWFELDEGYVHSSHVVPVHEQFHEPEDVIGGGFWGEITVPTSWQHVRPKLRSRRYYDLAYGTVYRVIDRADEEDGRAWYRLLDDANPRAEWWVQAAHVRRIAEEEFAPISSQVPPADKLIHVSIADQLLTCFEAGVPVFKTRIASGTTFIDAEGRAHHFNTPYGEHFVRRKTPARHMSGGEDINDSFDLPGVPWCTFFTAQGAAIHGTYWHNDYGRPRSHGCINVTPDAARWIYRWSYPFAGYEDEYLWTAEEEREKATRIIIE